MWYIDGRCALEETKWNVYSALHDGGKGEFWVILGLRITTFVNPPRLMKVLQPESVLIKEELETIGLKPGKSCYSLNIKKNPNFVMQVIIKNNLPSKKKNK